jgi:hypothetical protein
MSSKYFHFVNNFREMQQTILFQPYRFGGQIFSWRDVSNGSTVGPSVPLFCSDLSYDNKSLLKHAAFSQMHFICCLHNANRRQRLTTASTLDLPVSTI